MKASSWRTFIHGGYRTEVEPLDVGGLGTWYPKGTEPKGLSVAEQDLFAVWRVLSTQCVCGHAKRDHYAWTGHCTIGEEFDFGGNPQERGADRCARFTSLNPAFVPQRDGQQLERQGAYSDQLDRQDQDQSHVRTERRAKADDDDLWP